MKNRYSKMLLFIFIILCQGCKDKSTNPQQNEPENYSWIDFDKFRTDYNFGVYQFNIQTQLIRRTSYGQGNVSLTLDSTLNEYIETCTPINGDTTCIPVYYYSLVDSIWLGGNASVKLYHFLPLIKVVLADTTISYAEYTNSKISSLDKLIGKTLYASVSIVKSRVPSHDGINYSVDININIDQLALK
jgi:hypothetical protein